MENKFSLATHLSSEVLVILAFTCFRIRRNRRRAETDTGRAQFPSANCRNRSRRRSAVCSEHAGNAMGRRIGCEGSGVGERMHISTRSKSIFGWVQPFRKQICRRPFQSFDWSTFSSLLAIQLKFNVLLSIFYSPLATMFREPNWMKIKHKRSTGK